MKPLIDFCKNAVKYSLFFFIVLLLCRNSLPAFGKEIDKKTIPNVIIIALHGVRNSESIDEPTHQYISHLWNDIFKEGTLYTNVLVVDSPFHMPSIHAMVTGKHYSHFPEIRSPSLFQYARKKYGLAEQKTLSVGQWKYENCVYENADFGVDTYPSRVAVLSAMCSPEIANILTPAEVTFFDTLRDSMNKGFFGDIQFDYIHWDTLGEITHQIFKRALQTFKPKLALYAVGGTESAHYSFFGRYVLALERSDEMIYEIWNMINQDPFYKNNTYLIICPDTSRDSYFMHHVESCYDEPAKVWMYIYGPNIKKGIIIERPAYHVDVFATVDYIMNLGAPLNDGKVLKDCFR